MCMPPAPQVAPRAAAEPLPHAVEAVAAAAAQITLALQEAQQPVEQLGASVGRIITNAASLRNLAGTGRHTSVLAELHQDAMRATVALQFHDRLTQHLTHLHDYLAAASELLARASDACMEGQAAAARARQVTAWEELRDRLCSRLLTESQRQRLRGDLTIAGRAPEPAAGTANPFRDSIELF